MSATSHLDFKSIEMHSFLKVIGLATTPHHSLRIAVLEKGDTVGNYSRNIVYPEFILNEKFVCMHSWQGRSVQRMMMFVFQGCYDLVTSFMETNMGIIAGVAFGIAFSQVCA